MSPLEDHLEKLRAFATVAQLGSFRKAAARLRVSQPALSQSVQVLESVLGKQLLVRTARGVVPTEEGTLVRAFSERLSADVDVLARKLLAEGEPMAGRLRIGSYESLTISLLPGFVAHVHERFPRLSLSIASASVEVLPEMLLDRRIQVAVSTRGRRERHVVNEELYVEQYRFYVATKPPGGRDLRTKAPLVLVDADDDNGRTVLEYVEEATRRRRPTLILTTFAAVKAFTLHGVGVGVLPTLVAQQDVRAGRLREVEVPGAPRDGFGEHRIVAQLHEREVADHRVVRLVEELKRYASRRE
jgi:LysR family hydrogen peroxide-inducible transcriptional activator